MLILLSNCARKVFEVMRKQEQSRQAELAAEKAHFEALQSHQDIVSTYYCQSGAFAK